MMGRVAAQHEIEAGCGEGHGFGGPAWVAILPRPRSAAVALPRPASPPRGRRPRPRRHGAPPDSAHGRRRSRDRAPGLALPRTRSRSGPDRHRPRARRLSHRRRPAARTDPSPELVESPPAIDRLLCECNTALIAGWLHWYQMSNYPGINSAMDQPTGHRPTPRLGDFVRAHRARLSPAAARSSRRRPAGERPARREEVAQLAGISVTWYTWIEQGRDVAVSPGRRWRASPKTLQLSPAEPISSTWPGATRDGVRSRRLQFDARRFLRRRRGIFAPAYCSTAFDASPGIAGRAPFRGWLDFPRA